VGLQQPQVQHHLQVLEEFAEQHHVAVQKLQMKWMPEQALEQLQELP
jgi:hypothetical protein